MAFNILGKKYNHINYLKVLKSIFNFIEGRVNFCEKLLELDI